MSKTQEILNLILIDFFGYPVDLCPTCDPEQMAAAVYGELHELMAKGDLEKLQTILDKAGV